ncbi:MULTISPECIES: hypothetical protein [Pseudomonas]|uniref:hypothetical protein n=1 Tax=Pseudomonas TaxID=286 RepID=UPI0021CC5843|nr:MULTISPECIES: hypothetical protein [Pseudomonas]MEC4242242.1 hypothetical protein [Pseudomonas sp. DSV-1]
MSVEEQNVEGFELTFSVQIDENRILELLVDQVFAGDCVWQVTDAGGQVLARSDVYKDQAHCLRDGLNKVDHETRRLEDVRGKASSIAVGLIEAADNELEALRRNATRYEVLREHWLRIDDGTVVHRADGLDLWCDKRLPASKDQSPKS